VTRRALVLGAGGVLGAAWMTGALCAIEDEFGLDPRAADLIVGTSAGSVLTALLAAGLPAGTLRDHQRGLPLPGDLVIDWDYERSTGGARPPRPRFGVGSPDLLRRARRHEVPLRTALWAVLPPGRGTPDPLRRVVDAFVGAGRWAPRDGVWTVAMDYATGDRVAFGSPGAPPASLGDAVAASCANPGWYAPVPIAGRQYIDGGARSAASVDLLAGQRLDEVIVVAPMASLTMDRPSGLVARLERRWRRVVTSRVLAEMEVVRREGATVRLLCPGPSDLAAMGGNLMDPGRRLAVLETSLETSAAALRRGEPGESGGIAV
jgi:NTE family protein